MTQDAVTQDARTQDAVNQDARTQDAVNQDARTQDASQGARAQDARTQDAGANEPGTQEPGAQGGAAREAVTPALDAEDAKLVTLARGARARAGAAEGAAVRDTDGRTYAGATVKLPSLRLSALQVAVATAMSSAAAGLEAAAIVGPGGEPDDKSAAVAGDLRLPVLFTARADGTVTGRLGPFVATDPL